MKQYKNYINSEFRESKNTFLSINPATEDPWAEVSAASSKDVLMMLLKLQVDAFKGEWSEVIASAT